MDARLVGKVRDHRRVHVDQRPLRMVGKEMPAAGLAPLALAVRRLREAADVVGTARDAHGVGLPERKGVHRAGRPLAARLAVNCTAPQKQLPSYWSLVMCPSLRYGLLVCEPRAP